MAGRRLEERNIRKLTKMGGGRSLGITLPIEIVRKLKWKERQNVVVALEGKSIRVRDYRKRT